MPTTWTKPGHNLDKIGQNLDKTWTKEALLGLFFHYEVLSSFVHLGGFGQDGYNQVLTTRFCPGIVGNGHFVDGHFVDGHFVEDISSNGHFVDGHFVEWTFRR